MSKNGKTCGNWGHINGKDWAYLLGRQPQFADKCDWSKLDGTDWVSLLVRQPRFADKCDWTKLNGGDWLDLLEVRPEFTDRCDWSTFCGADIMRMICQPGHPRISSLLLHLDDCDLNVLGAYQWSRVLAVRPDLAERFESVRRDWLDGDAYDVDGERQLPLDDTAPST